MLDKLLLSYYIQTSFRVLFLFVPRAYLSFPLYTRETNSGYVTGPAKTAFHSPRSTRGETFHCHQGVAHPIFHSPRHTREKTSWTSFQILEPFHFHSPRPTRGETLWRGVERKEGVFHSLRPTRGETATVEPEIIDNAFIPLASRERKPHGLRSRS